MNTAYDELHRKIQLASSTLYGVSSGRLRSSGSITPPSGERVLGTSTGSWHIIAGGSWIRSDVTWKSIFAAVLDREWRAVLERVEAIFEHA